MNDDAYPPPLFFRPSPRTRFRIKIILGVVHLAPALMRQLPPVEISTKNYDYPIPCILVVPANLFGRCVFSHIHPLDCEAIEKIHPIYAENS